MKCLEGNLRKVIFIPEEIIFQIPNFCIGEPTFIKSFDTDNETKEKMIKINLIYFDKNKNIKLDISNISTVEKLKKIFAKNIGIENLNKYKIRLFFQGKELIDSKSLIQYGIKNNSKIHISLNLI